MSAIDSALHNLDILTHIFDVFDTANLSQDWYRTQWFKPDRTVQKFLARAALTCRAFRTPALNALWKKMEGILPLLRLLPAFAEVDNVYVSVGSI